MCVCGAGLWAAQLPRADVKCPQLKSCMADYCRQIRLPAPAERLQISFRASSHFAIELALILP